MPVGGDVIELVHRQSYLGQQLNNVYYFESVDGSTPLATLANWFETNIVPLVKNMQNDLVTHDALNLKNLFAPEETYEELLTGAGAVASGLVEGMTFLACQVRFDHNEGNVRPGFKRIGGVPMGLINDTVWTAAQISAMDSFGAALINPLTPALASWVHVIINRVCREPNPDPAAIPSCLRYGLPEVQAESAPGYPIAYVSYPQPTTQNSRKWYTG